MINSRLFDWYGIDTQKNLKIKNICPRPFDTVLIDKQGSCYICECTSWLPQSAGNLNLQSLSDILESAVAKTLRDSILDGSYRYCNNKQCSYLLDARNEGVPWSEKIPSVQIKNIRLAIDDSCNLSCPSCRTKIIFEKEKSILKKRCNLVDKVIDYVKTQSHVIKIHIGSDGDPFASLVYRYFLKKIKNIANVQFTIQTNGLLIKKMYQRYNELFEKLEILNISIDGATRETYEKLRRGGSYKKIIENLQTVKELQKKYKFKFIIHFVVQLENYKDMIPMIELAKQYGAERLWFNRITNWNTYKDFSNIDVLDNNNKDYQLCTNEIEKILKLNETKVIIEMPTMITKQFKKQI